MRVFLAAFVLLLPVVPSAPAAVPKRGCDTRAEGSKPVRPFVAPTDIKLGPVAFFGLERLADPDEFARYRSGDRYLIKAPLKVRAGRVVTLSIAPASRAVAGLTFVHDGPREQRGVPAVKFVACDKRERAFSYDGVVGPVTAFAGGFSLAEPACVDLMVRLRGHRFVYRRTVSFGMGSPVGNCNKI